MCFSLGPGNLSLELLVLHGHRTAHVPQKDFPKPQTYEKTKYTSSTPEGCLHAGTDMDRGREPHGRTPLHLAALHERLEVLQYLLQAGAGKDVEDTSLSRRMELTPLGCSVLVTSQQVLLFPVLLERCLDCLSKLFLVPSLVVPSHPLSCFVTFSGRKRTAQLLRVSS